LYHLGDWVYQLFVSPDNKYLYFCSLNGTIQCYYFERQIVMKKWKFPGGILAFDLFSDGSFFVAAYKHGSIYFRNTGLAPFNRV